VRKAAAEHYPLLGTLALYLAGVLLVSPLADLPLNDDWVYALDVVRSVERGALTFLGVESAWGIPQVWLGLLLGPVRQLHVQLRALQVGFSILSLVFLYVLLLKATRNKPLLLLLLGGCAAFPPFFLVSLTFMSDQLFLLLLTVASLLLHEALRRRSAAWLLAAAVGCLPALLQRQYGLLLAAPLVVAALGGLRRDRVFAASGAAGAALLVFAYLLASRCWMARAGTPAAPSLSLHFSLGHQAFYANSLVFFTGLLVAPTFLACGRASAGDDPRGWGAPRPLRLALLLVTAAFVCLAGFRLARDVNAPFAGNLFSAYGVFRVDEVLAGAREVNLPAWMRVLLSALGLFFLHPALARIAARLRPGAAGELLRVRPDVIVPLLFAALYVAALAVRGVFFDRYFLPLVPAVLFLSALLLDGTRFGRRMIAGLAAVLAIMAFSVTTARDYFSWNGAKWELAERTARRLRSPEDLDGGYEWNGWHGTAAHPSLTVAPARHAVSFSPLPGARVLDAAEWRSLWPPHARKMFVVERQDRAP
jgi:hypothetical protein